MYADIISGAATLTAIEKTVDKATILGWALPGGKFTADPVHAQAVASRMAQIIGSYWRRRHGNATH